MSTNEISIIITIHLIQVSIVKLINLGKKTILINYQNGIRELNQKMGQTQSHVYPKIYIIERIYKKWHLKKNKNK